MNRVWIRAAWVLPLAVACGGNADGQGKPGTKGMSGKTATVPQAEVGRVPCDLSTDYAGDDLCILPPEPGDGMQIHLGPSDYDDPDAVAPFMVAPGVENVECHYQTLNNDAL